MGYFPENQAHPDSRDGEIYFISTVHAWSQLFTFLEYAVYHTFLRPEKNIFQSQHLAQNPKSRIVPIFNPILIYAL